MNLCPAFMHIGGKQRDFLKCASSQLSLAQNNQYAKVTYFWVAYSATLHCQVSIECSPCQ